MNIRTNIRYIKSNFKDGKIYKIYQITDYQLIIKFKNENIKFLDKGKFYYTPANLHTDLTSMFLPPWYFDKIEDLLKRLYN